MADLPMLVKIANIHISEIFVLGISLNDQEQPVVIIEYRGYPGIILYTLNTNNEEEILSFLVRRLKQFQKRIDEMTESQRTRRPSDN